MTMREKMARAIRERVMSPQAHPPYETLQDATKEMWLSAADAALDALMESAETSGMDGSVMNAMCAAFGWPDDAGRFPNAEGLTECCARAVTAFLSAAKGGVEGKRG